MTEKIITVIGGGSVNWMRGLMRDVYLLDEIKGGEIRLVDPNRKHTEAVAEMLCTFNRIRKKEYRISIIENRREALDGADFVLTTFSPGSMDAFWNDLELPIKYGIRQPVSMTVGVSGISAALRTIPVAYEIVEDMEEMCPGAWLLNVTNPMSTVTRAMNLAAKKTRVIGMCHEFHALQVYPSLCNVRNGYAMKYGVIKSTVDMRRYMKINEYQYILDVAAGKAEVPWERTGEEMTELMRAIINDKPTTGIVNMPNLGQIANLPENVVVETLATVSADRIVPKMSGELPGPIGSLCRLHADIHELTVKAALEGDKNIFIQALSLDPTSGCADFSEMPELAEELLNANREWLPRFFK